MTESNPAGGAGPPTILSLAGITKVFGDLTANDAIDLDVGRGEIVALLGENGAGKTTLMNILFGHYVADAGTVSVEADGALRPLPAGSPQAALQAGIGMVHQHFTLAENLSAFDNIVLGTEPVFRLSRASAEPRRRLNALMQQSGLTVDAVLHIPTDFEVLHDRVTKPKQYGADDPQKRASLLVAANRLHRLDHAVSAGK